MQTPAAQNRARREALVVALAGILAFTLLAQERLYGDGPLLLLSYRRGLATAHALHHHLAGALAGLGLSPMAAARAASALPAGLALGVVHRAATTAGYGLGPARVAALVLALTPSVLFFATTVEVHGLALLGAALGLYGATLALRPDLGALRVVLALVLAALALGATHPVNATAGAGLAVLAGVALLRRGAPPVAVVVVATLGLAGLAWGAREYAARQGTTILALLEPFAWRFDATGPAGLPRPLDNLLQAVVLPIAWLWIPGLAGLGLLLASRERRALGVGLALWVLPPTLLLAGPDFTERGAYALVVVPALAFGVAELHRHALAHPASRRALALLVVVGLALTAQLLASWRGLAAWDRPPPDEAAAWVVGLRELSGGRGVVLAADIHQQDWSRSWCGLQADNARLYLALPEDELEARARNYAGWAAAAARDGEPLWVSAAILDLAPDLPPLARAVAALEERFAFEPVTAAGYRGYRGRLRAP